METTTMGRVVTEATIENLEDLWAAKRGLLKPEQVRRITVSDALADAGATMLSLPSRLIRALGSRKPGAGLTVVWAWERLMCTRQCASRFKVANACWTFLRCRIRSRC